MTDIVQRIRNRIHDAPMPTERLLDEAGDEIERLRAEIKEYEQMAYRFSCVLDQATGGRMSKTNYDADIMCAVIEDHIQCQCDLAIAEHLEELAKAKADIETNPGAVR